MTTVDQARGASVSPDGRAETIALVDEATSSDGGAEAGGSTDGGVVPHPERDAGARDDTGDRDGNGRSDGGGDEDDSDDADGPGKGKGKPPKKQD